MHDMIYTLAEAFHAQHKQLYIVGGTVRDVLLHREESNDEDLATDATPDEIKDLFFQIDASKLARVNANDPALAI